MSDAELGIEGMHCDGCARRIKTVLEREPGVQTAEVSFAEKRARVRYNPHAIDTARLAGLIETAGFTAGTPEG